LAANIHAPVCTWALRLIAGTQAVFRRTLLTPGVCAVRSSSQRKSPMPLFCEDVAVAGVRPILIVLSHLRWDFVMQRPHHVLNRAAADFDIWFMEEPVIEGSIAMVREMSRGAGITVVQPVVPAGTSAADALAHQGEIAARLVAKAGSAPVCLWYYAPMARAFGQHLSADLVIYDKMTEPAAFAFAPPDLAGHDAALLREADVVFTGGASLQIAASLHRSDAHCFPSSIDAVHFGQARDAGLADPESQRMIAHPRLGYFGVIDERMDLALIAEVAALRPDWQFVMIGPTARIDPDSLPKVSNIHWLGARPYASLPHYMAHWDLAWMPFARNEATRHISPTKTPEFLAAGLPVISTPIADVISSYGRLGLVEIAIDAPDVVACAKQILENAADPVQHRRRLAAVDAQLAGDSWDATWAAMRGLIAAAAQTTPLPARQRAERSSAHA
jgi:Glycosyl transferases group 1